VSFLIFLSFLKKRFQVNVEDNVNIFFEDNLAFNHGQNNDKEAHLSQKQTVQMDVDSQNTTTTNGHHLEAVAKNGCRSKQRSRNWHFTKKKKEKKNGPCFNQSLNDSRGYDR